MKNRGLSRGAALIVTFLSLLLCWPASRSEAAGGPTAVQTTLSGVLVDITCATDPKKNPATLRTQHTRKCLLMPVCADSGYGLLTNEDKVLRFDAKGNELAHKLIEKHPEIDSWKISVKGGVEGDHVVVERIRLLK